MLGLAPDRPQLSLFAYDVNLELRIPSDHLLRKLAKVINLDFVVPTVAHLYGRSGHVSLDPRMIVKMMLLLFLYNIDSERELMEQINVRLDFLWFLGLDLEAEIPHHSVLSKARSRWGPEVFEQLFTKTVAQCVQAGLVDGRLLHADSTIVKANANLNSVVQTGPELVQALREACQRTVAKLEVLPAAPEASSPTTPPPAAAATPAAPATPELTVFEPTSSPEPEPSPETPPIAAAPEAPAIVVLPPPSADAEAPKAPGEKLPANCTRISLTDPEAQLGRNKAGLTDLNYKDHRLVDDAHGVITAVSTTHSNAADGAQLRSLAEQHRLATGLNLGQVTIAGDHHYGSADNYLYCLQEGIRPHLGPMSANVEQRGKFDLSRFIYQPERDQLLCPQGHVLELYQHRPQENLKAYRIKDPATCAGCPLRSQCTEAEGGRTIRRHVQAEEIAAAQAEAKSPAGRYSRKRRQHVMEGTFADAANNHGSKRARWRGLSRQRIQSCLIAAVQNLRILISKSVRGPGPGALAGSAGPLAELAALSSGFLALRGWIASRSGAV